MIYLIFGNNLEKSREKLQSLVAQFFDKENKNSVCLAGGSFFEFNEDDFSEDRFNEIYKTSALFSSVNMIVSKRHFSIPALSKFHLANLDKYNRSEHILVFWEESLDKPCQNAFKKYKEKVYEFNLKKIDKSKTARFSRNAGDTKVFGICDAFARRTRHDSWLLYQEALLDGVLAEAVFWKILWQIKTLLSIKESGPSGLHPFVYKKNTKKADLFKTEELENYLAELVNLFHNDRFGKTNLKVGLERFLLKI